MASFTLPVWIRLLKHDVAKEEVEIQSSLEALLVFCKDRLLSPLVDGAIEDPEVSHFAEADFFSQEDLKDFLGAVRNRICDVVRLISQTWPQRAIMCVASEFQGLYAASSNGQAGPRVGAQWEAFVVLWDGVMLGASKKLLTQGSASVVNMQPIYDSLAATLQFETADPALHLQQLGIMASMFPVLQHQPDFLNPVVGKIFASVRCEQAGPAVQRRGCELLIKLCKKSTGVVVDILPALVAQIQEIFTLATIDESMRRMLTEALLTAGNKLPDPAQHQQFVSEILDPVAANLASVDFKARVETPANMISSAGLCLNPSAEQLEQRSMLRNCTVTIAAGLTVTVGRLAPGQQTGA